MLPTVLMLKGSLGRGTVLPKSKFPVSLLCPLTEGSATLCEVRAAQQVLADPDPDISMIDIKENISLTFDHDRLRATRSTNRKRI